MVWIDVFRAFLSLCGLAVVVFVLVQIWKALVEGRPRRAWRVAAPYLAIAALAIFFVVVMAIDVSSQTRGVLAVVGFFTVAVPFLIAAVVLGRRAHSAQTRASNRADRGRRVRSFRQFTSRGVRARMPQARCSSVDVWETLGRPR